MLRNERMVEQLTKLNMNQRIYSLYLGNLTESSLVDDYFSI